jgi:hypothetical protein
LFYDLLDFTLMHLFLTTSLGLTFLFGSRRVKTKKRAPGKTFLWVSMTTKRKKEKKGTMSEGRFAVKQAQRETYHRHGGLSHSTEKAAPSAGLTFAREKIRRFGDNVRLYDSYMDQDDGTLERALAVVVHARQKESKGSHQGASQIRR